MHTAAARILIAIALTLPVAAWARDDAPQPASGPRIPTGSPTWEAIPRAPIAGRISAGVVWTGEEMIVWGGVTRSRAIEAVSDGAAFDPVDGTWREIAPSPHGVLGGGGRAAAWTGRRAVFWAGNSPDGPARGAVYNPASDHWQILPRGPLGSREGYVSVWTGTELLIVGGTLGDGFPTPVAAALDPRARSWRRLPGLDALDAIIPSGAVWSGDRMFLAGTQYLCPVPDSVCEETREFLVAYDPATDELEEIDLAAAPAASVAPIGWTGTEVLATGADRAHLVLFDPSDSSWRSASAAPCAVDGFYRQSAWLGDRYVTTCGRDALQVYDVATDAWEVVEAGRSPMNVRAGSAIVWTGTDLVAWSGTARRAGNPTPNAGMSITLGP
jgi:hypothetical protein